MRCSIFRNLRPIEPVQDMISLLLVLLLLVLLFLFLLLIILNNNVKNVLASENIDKGKSILGAPPKLDKKEIKNPRAKKGNTQKLKQKKQHFCHHCGTAGHTRHNCYKWLATQQSNSMIASGNQNQFPSSFARLRDILKALMFLSNLNGLNSFPSSQDQGFAKRKGSSKVWKEKGSK